MWVAGAAGCTETYIPCQQHWNCPADMVCEENGRCIPDADCGAGQVCEPDTATCGSRGPACESDADCLGGQRCDSLSGICRTGGCVSDADCMGGQYCDRSAGSTPAPAVAASDLCCSDLNCPAPLHCELVVDVNNLALTICQ